VVADFEKEPSSFICSVANNYESVNDFCIDQMGANVPKATLLNKIKRYVAAEIASMFGFYGFPSLGKTYAPGAMPFICSGDRAQWGHAILVAGYDDNKRIKNNLCNTVTTGTVTTGALPIRNSWKTGCSDDGYGWLPHECVLAGLSSDFWSILSMKWVDTGKFGFD
jgi:C1A family cysteine protease